MDKHERELVYSLITRLCDLDDTLTRKQRLDILNELCLENCNKNVEDILNNAQKRRRLQMKRGNASENETFTGLPGEITFDTTNKTIRVHDGETPGGTVLAKQSDIVTKTFMSPPDYGNGISYTFTNETAAPEDGYFEITGTAYNNLNLVYKLNGVSKTLAISTNSYFSTMGYALLPVCKGDTIQGVSSYNPGTIVFYAMR